jgi:hypothetical protein
MNANQTKPEGRMDEHPSKRIYDALLENERAQFEKTEAFRNVAALLDHYSRFRRPYKAAHYPVHRWTGAEVGNTFVGIEDPDATGNGLVFKVEIAAVLGPSEVSLKVIDAFDVECDAEGRFSVAPIESISDQVHFLIDGTQLITTDMTDRICDVLGDEFAGDRLRLLIAIQAWALQSPLFFLT